MSIIFFMFREGFLLNKLGINRCAGKGELQYTG